MEYLVILAFLVVVSLLMSRARKANKKYIAMIVCIAMICIAGLRRGYIDTRAYRRSFEALSVSQVLNWDFIRSQSNGWGFAVVSAVIKLFVKDSQVFLFTMSLVTVGLLFWGIVRSVPNYDVGIFLLITTGCFLDTMNGVRQYLVSAVLFYFLPQFLQKRKFLSYTLLVLVMSSIHSSAILFIPLYFLANRKPWSGYTALLVAVGVIAYVFFNSGIGHTIAELLDGTIYGSAYGNQLEEGNTSTNVFRVIVAAVPVVMAFVSHGGKWAGNPMYNIAFNLSVINILTWLFSTKVLYFYRLAMYFSPYMILLLCFELDAIRSFKNKRTLTVVAIICYLIFHMYSIYTMGDILFVGYLKY